MAKIREVEVIRDEDGNVVSEREVIRSRDRHLDANGVDHRPRRSSIGPMIFAVALAALAVGGYAYTQGGFMEAGREADQATAQVQQQVATATENAGDALEQAGDNAEQATDQVAPQQEAADTTQPSETGSN